MNSNGHLSPDVLMGWMARMYRLTASDPSEVSIDAFLKRTSIHFTRSMVSMLENGERRWGYDLASLYDKQLRLKTSPFQRAYLCLGGGIGSLKGREQDYADLIDEISSGEALKVPSLSMVEAILWATEKNVPIGRKTWEKIVVNYVDVSCDSKGIPATNCDYALPALARHPIAGNMFLEYAESIANQKGHPTAFVPIIAMQANGTNVDVGGLVRQIRSPDNRWLIREYLNLASSRLFDCSLNWNETQVSEVLNSARDWMSDGNSEDEVVRSASYLKYCAERRLAGMGAPSAGTHASILKRNGMQAVSIARKILMKSEVEESRYDSVVPVLSALLAGSLYSDSDEDRRLATRVLSTSPIVAEICDFAMEEIGGDGSVVHASKLPWVRLLGKLGSSRSDAEFLWRLFDRSVDRRSLETVAWAVRDISVVAFPVLQFRKLLELPKKSLSRSNGTISRAVISAYGRAGRFDVMRALEGLSGSPAEEASWWLRHRGSPK